MAFNIGQDTGYTAGTGGPTAATTSIMQKLQEELKKKQAAMQAQQAAAAKAAQAKRTAVGNAQVGNKPIFQNMFPDVYPEVKTPGLSDYSKWYESGAPNLAPMLDPNNVYQGRLRPEYGQRNWGYTVDKLGYVYDETDPRRWDYMIKDYQNADLRPDQVRGWTPPDILAEGGGELGDGGGTGGGIWDYPVYNYGGGGGAKKINEWYANMVQWNINRPKGG